MKKSLGSYQFFKETEFSEANEIPVREILSRIESHALLIASQVISNETKGKDISFDLVIRRKDNLMVEEDTSVIRLGRKKKRRKLGHERSVVAYSRMWSVLNAIHSLLLSGKHMTQRELFYLLVHDFDNQLQLNSIIQDVVSLLQVPREVLGIYAGSRGFISGSILWNADGGGSDQWVHCGKLGLPGLQIPGYFPHNLNIETEGIHYIIVVEKDGVFKRLVEDRFFCIIPCAIVTACGYPDLSTRKVIHYLKRKFQVPVLGLFDYNPHGLSILMTYKFGSARLGLESFRYTIPDMKWLGLHSKDVEELDLIKTQFNQNDQQVMKRLKEIEFIQKNKQYREELDKMKYKVEIQTIHNWGYEYFSQVFMRKKILKRQFF